MSIENPGASLQFLITSLGLGPYLAGIYEFEGERYPTCYAPAATAKLAGLSGATALVLLTSAARNGQHWLNLDLELHKLGLQTEVIEISDRAERDDTFRLLDRLVRRIAKGSRVTLDVTHGLRHLPFVYNSALAFLSGLADVEISKVVYGAWELRTPLNPDPIVPIVDITHTFALIKWFRALSTFRETGDGRPLARSLTADVRDLFLRSRPEHELGNVRNAVTKLTKELAAGLPLEAGLEASRLNVAIESLAASGSDEVPSRLAAELIHSETKAIALNARDKARIVLDECELERQLQLALWYAKRDEVGKSFAILREWMVNGRLFACRNTANWLERKSREFAEHFFANLFYRREAGMLTDASQKLVAALWDSISQHRNALQHAGMTDKGVGGTRDQAEKCVAACRALMGVGFAGLESRAGSARLLISPLGMSPGVVYTAIKRTEPAALFIVTSSDARPLLGNALEAAAWKGPEAIVRQVEDPFAGFNEANALIDSEAKAALSQAAEILVNLTGGTTAMQWVVETIAQKAEILGFPVGRIALIDRRPYAEQLSDPYVLGDMIRLDGPRDAP